MPLISADNNINNSGSQNYQRKRTDSTSSLLKSEKGSNANNIQNHSRSKSTNSVVRKTSSSNLIIAQNQTQNRPEELPLSFASFYYSLKVIKGKGMMI
jgi:hypothetical protein